MTQFPAGDQRLLRSINERAVLEQTAAVGCATRADIANSAGLSKPTVAIVLVTLIERGWVEEAGSVVGRKARWPPFTASGRRPASPSVPIENCCRKR